jgi:C4-dicarboxylate transporter DctM subunit
MTLSISAVSLIVVFLVAMFIGIPVAWSLWLTCIVSVMLDPTLTLSTLPVRAFAYANNYAWLAVPCFFLAGDIMSRGGLSKRLVSFADSLVGWITGGISIVSIVASAFFAAISGSSVATTAAIGSILYPEMVKRGYPEDYSAAIQATGGTLGIVIPPSIVMVVYGNITGVSVADLLMSGIIPGVLTAVFLSIYAYFKAKKNHYPKNESFSFARFLASFKDAIWALIMPIIILGGIYTGIFTPTESAAIAVAYGLLICLALYRELTGKTLWELLKGTTVSTASLMFLVVAAQTFGYLITYYNIASAAATLITSIASSKFIYMAMVIILLTFCGMFMDVGASNLVLSPILAPIAALFDIDPVHFGLVVVFLLSMGQATPPFGTCMFVACSVSGRPVAGVAKQLIPLALTILACGILWAYVPVFSTFIPNLLN